jgi:AcrR family transcriptional regulator
MQTKRQIELVEAAIRVTANDGIQKLTIRNVASAIGVSEAAVYRHFASKHELLQAILVHLDSLLAPQFATLHASQGSYKEALTKFINDLFTLLEHNTAFTLMLFAEETFNVDIQLKPQLDALVSGNLKQLAKFYTDAIAEKRCRADLKPIELAMITFGTIRLYVSRWHMQDQPTNLMDYAAPVTASLSTLFSLQ